MAHADLPHTCDQFICAACPFCFMPMLAKNSDSFHSIFVCRNRFSCRRTLLPSGLNTRKWTIALLQGGMFAEPACLARSNFSTVKR